MRSMHTTIRHCALGLALVAAGPAAAETPGCEARGSNGMVTLVLCPAGLDREGWHAAGVAACAGRRPCGAWIWEDAARIPESAPDSHDALPAEAIAAAVAIWVEEDRQLILIERIED